MAASAVLIVDISGSTPLYEKHGTERALEEIGQCLHRLQAVTRQNDGKYVNSKGDDVLALFDTPEAAFLAARKMFSREGASVLSLHGGLYWGDVTHLDGNVYGTPVYTAARLAALAKPGELLIGDTCLPMLSETSLALLRQIGPLQLKGRKTSTEVCSYIAADTLQLTQIEALPAGSWSERAGRVRLSFDGADHSVAEGETLVIGRSHECDLVVPAAWVSRRHATVTVMQGLVEYTDHSSTASYVVAADGRQYEICRKTIALDGQGKIYVGAPSTGPAAVPISYEVLAGRRA